MRMLPGKVNGKLSPEAAEYTPGWSFSVRLAVMPVHSARHHYDPFEVSLIVERFEARHALRLFAVGHGYLGFLKTAAWTPAAIAPLIEDIQFLLAHSFDPPDVPPATAITDWLTAHDHIFLACTPTVPHR